MADDEGAERDPDADEDVPTDEAEASDDDTALEPSSSTPKDDATIGEKVGEAIDEFIEDVQDMAEEVVETAEETAEKLRSGRIDANLEAIRARRSGTTKRKFPRTFEDFALVFGVSYFLGYLAFLGIMLLIPGTFVDSALSQTWFDTGDGECENQYDNPHVTFDYLSGHIVQVSAGQLEDGETYTLEWALYTGSKAKASNLVNQSTETGNPPMANISYTPKDEGNLFITAVLSLDNDTLSDHHNEIHLDEDGEIRQDGDGRVSTGTAYDSPRACKSVEDLSKWAFVLMGAELGGGRETAMLTGGQAGIPAWWMAFVSLSLSVFTLYLIYPLIYYVYHQDADDILDHDSITRLVENSVRASTDEMKVDVDWSLFRVNERELSIDIMVPYANTQATVSSQADIRAGVLKGILAEFGLFRVFKPVQLTVRSVDDSGGVDFDLSEGASPDTALPEASDDQPHLVEDYSDFFSNVNTLGRIEEQVQQVLEGYFKREDMTDTGSAVMSDDHAVYLRVIYRPTVRFAFFQFKTTQTDVQKEIHAYLTKELGDLIGERELVVTARNEVQTIADRSSAGRLEHNVGKSQYSDQSLLLVGMMSAGAAFFFALNNSPTSIGTIAAALLAVICIYIVGYRVLTGRRVEQEDAVQLNDDRVAAVARQEGVAGRVLQTKLFGGMISTIEYTANEKREFINKWGFWGLIVFVWIPFMASGVLVGAMLGLVSRMDSRKVLGATTVGGAAASVTWAYTADWIVAIMHKYNLEIAIPILIAVFIGLAVIHMRTTKQRRQQELFEEAMLDTFQLDIQSKYGSGGVKESD